ncbi:MAG: DNA polymerase I [Planctomycetota bacterium]|nr:DNA polymerase I [Planctomycetota bacterium]MDA1210902.1 DNA polymerase I [Planctomycetota bacterium]
MPDVLYLIDTFSLMFQVYHGIPSMTGPAGQPTNAVFGFTRDLLNILRDKKPSHLLCAFDSPGPGQREELYPAYKANRSAMPEDLVPQIPFIEEVIRGFHVPKINAPGWEADDVLATLTKLAVERGMMVYIVTNDKDARQLLGPQVKLLNLRKNIILDEAFLLGDWGIRPDQVVDFQSLVGDSVDNVPGVPGIGPKTATALLSQFGTLEDVLKNAETVTAKRTRENLKTYAEQALLSRELVRLKTDLPLDIDWDAVRVTPPDHAKLSQLFRDFGFRRFNDEVRQLWPAPTVPTGSLFSAEQLDGNTTSVPVSGVISSTAEAPTASEFMHEPSSPLALRKWETIDTEEKFTHFLSELKQHKTFCFDLETTSLDALRAKIVGWAFSWQENSSFYLPVQGPAGQQHLVAKTVAAALKPILESPDVELCNQNIKYDLLVLRGEEIRPCNIGVDPMVASYLLDAGARSHGMDALSERYLNHRPIPISDLIGSGKNQKNMADIEIAKVAEYASEDADVTWQLADLLSGELKSQDLWELYWDLERPLILVLVEMEANGIKVDSSELQRQSQNVTGRLETLLLEIYELAGREFNVDSPLQLRAILFDELKLPVIKKTKTGPSTDQDVLEQLAPMHPLPAKMIEHRQLSKLKGTYLDALPSMINPETEKIHASFNQVVAATGRLSSSDPNLQNIPIRTPEGRLVRKAFIPSQPDWKLVCADYSQVELRVLAHFSRDAALLDAFHSGADIHTAVAADVFGIAKADVDSDMRRIAKAVNFGVIYGQSAFGLAAALGIDQSEAAEFIEQYFTRYAGVDRYLTELLEECRKTGYAKTICGRRRAIEGIRPVRNRQRNLPERTAINTVIQGSAADLIKRAMIDIHDRLNREQRRARMLLQIHDELVFEIPPDEMSDLVGLIRRDMETALPLDVPVVVDVSIGENWLDVDSWADA